MKILSLFALLAVSTTFASPALIPMPLDMKDVGGFLPLTDPSAISFVGKAARQPAELLAAQLRPATGFDLAVKPGGHGTIVFRLVEDESLGDEGYALSVTDHISISAPTPKGLFYGAQSLRQLLPPQIFSGTAVDLDWKVPKVKIRDVPRFGWRGMHLDVARFFMPKEDVLRFIDTIASLKFNTFHWHLTDDQGWRVEIRKYPKLTEVGAWRAETLKGHLKANPGSPEYDGVPHGGFYTQEDIREIVAYAAERQITIVPEIDMPGHMQAAIAAYPELGSTTNQVAVMTTWGVSEDILSPEESSVQFCKDVLAEVMELFPSKFIHIGGDEAKKTYWEASGRVQRLREERGLKDMHEMQAWFIRRINDFLVANDRRLIGWEEIREGGGTENTAIMWWRGWKGTAAAIEAANDGHDMVMAPTTHTYFDFYQSEDKEKEPLAIGNYLSVEKVYHFDPVIDGLDAEAASRVMGAQGQLWREYMPTTRQVEYMAFPRACALAEVVWLPKEQKDYGSFLDRMKAQQQRYDAAAVNYRKIGEQ